MDDQTWIWDLVKSALEESGKEPLRLPSTVPIRHSWARFKNSERIIIHWETKQRSGGALVEEILDVSPHFDVGDRIIILTGNPTHEDVVYFSELGIKRIITLRNRDVDRGRIINELKTHICEPPERNKYEAAWRRIHRAIDHMPAAPDTPFLERLEEAVRKLTRTPPSARCLDAKASLAAAQQLDQEAMRLWMEALDKNPNYFRTFHNLIKFYRRKDQLEDALGLMKKMQELNKSNISRLVDLGEVQLSLADFSKAEHYFRSALDRDAFCSGALNGLAEIRFSQGNLEESRKLLERSSLAYKTAKKLNSEGIQLVRQQRYSEALEHYTKAQYVLPQQEKGPKLFYNIGLCYSRWGRQDMAREFLRIALVKQPEYEKAKRLLEAIEAQSADTEELE
jgi:tetratricopeptide (TPR) repeat protein